MPEHTGLLGLFAIGFTYSLYHCVGMCGGFVAAYSATCSLDRLPRQGGGSQNGAIPGGVLRRWEPWLLHLLFNIGRVVSYTILGAAFGYAGSWAAYYSRLSGARLQGIVGIAGGCMMILFGLSLLGLARMPAGTMLGGNVVKRLFQQLLRSRSPWRTFPLGMLVGTVPCGLIYSMSSYALSTQSMARGALAMAAFGSGTIPAMFCFGFVSTTLGPRFRKGMLGIAVALTLFMGVQAILRGLGALG